MIQLSNQYKNHELILLLPNSPRKTDDFLILSPTASLIPGIALAYYLYHLSGMQLTFSSSILLFLLFALSSNIHSFLSILLLLLINLASSLYPTYPSCIKPPYILQKSLKELIPLLFLIPIPFFLFPSTLKSFSVCLWPAYPFLLPNLSPIADIPIPAANTPSHC